MPGRCPGDQASDQDGSTMQHLLGGVGAREKLEPAFEALGQDDKPSQIRL